MNVSGLRSVAAQFSAAKRTGAKGTTPQPVPSGPPAGSYTGSNPQDNEPITFFVAANRRELQDISIPYVTLPCTPSTGVNAPQQPLGLAAVPLSRNGSFHVTTTQQGVYKGYAATYTYVFRGSFSAAAGSANRHVAGTFRETMTYKDTARRHCTSGNVAWTATRDAQPVQPNGAPPVGSYSATNPQDNEPITFFVAANQRELQDISIPYVTLPCTPSTGVNAPQQPLGLAAVPLSRNGSFHVTTTQQGVYKGYAATYTYVFRGNVHGVSPKGAPRLAGMFRETMSYRDTALRRCTSNNQSWTATRDSQPPQAVGRPPAGTYSATNPQDNEPITFQVSSHPSELQHISIPYVTLYCTPSTGVNAPQQPLDITSIALRPAGAFHAKTTAQGTFDGHQATFTYSFRGNFHGVNSKGAARAAGTFLETMTYTDTAKRTCTSNEQSWTATLTSRA